MPKSIDLKIIAGKQSRRCSLHPPKGQEWTKDGAYRVMSEYVNDLVNKTGQEFRVARVGPMAFNVIHLADEVTGANPALPVSLQLSCESGGN